MPDSIQNIPPMPDLNSIGSWSKSDYELLTADFVSKMTADQIHAMNHTSWMPDAAAAGFTPEMVASINISMYWFGAGWLNNLSTTAIQALTQKQMGEFTPTTLCGLDANHLSALKPEQVSAIQASFYWFTDAWLNNLSIPALQAITGTQLNGLTSTNLSKLDSTHAAALTATQVASWSTTYYWLSSTFLNNLNTQAFQAITAAHLNEITGANFGALDKTQIASITAENLRGLNNSHLSSLSAEQVSAIAHLDALSSAQFGLLNISGLSVSTLENLAENEFSALTAGQLDAISNEKFAVLNLSRLSTSTIGAMSKAAYEKLTAEQISSLSAAQINAMGHAAWMQDTAAAGFTLDQIKNCTQNFYWFSPGWFNHLTKEAFQAIKPENMGQMFLDAFNGLNAERRAQLTAAQVGGITYNFYFFSPEWFNSLSPQAMKGITADQLAHIQTDNFKHWDNEHLTALTAAQVAVAPHLNALTSDQFGLLDISGLSTASITNLTQTEYAGLTLNQFASLSTAQIQAMTHAQWLPTAVISKLTAEQTAALGNQLAQFTAEQVAAMNNLQDMNSTQFGLLNISGLPTSVIANLTSIEYVGLSAKQTAALSAEQINNLQHIDLLSVAAVSGFTAAQMPALSDNVLAHLSADQVAAITHLSALNSQQFGLLNIAHLSESAINSLSKTEYEGLTALQISTLSPAQIHAMAHTSWMPDATASAFTPEQVQNISIGMNWFSAGWLNNLSIEAFQALTPTQTSQISSATLAALDNEHLHALTAEQIGGMNNFGGLSSAQFGLLDLSKMQTSVISNWSQTLRAGVTAQQVSTLSNEQVNALQSLNGMSVYSAAGFSKDQIPHIRMSFYYFSSAWYNNLTTEAFQAITPEQMGQIFLDAFNGMDAERRSQLTAEQVGGITYNFYFFSSVWFNSLNPQAMKGITADQFTHIQADNFKHWDNQHLAALTAAQVAVAPHLNALTSDQFGYLDISQLPVSAISQLSKTEYQGLTAQQIASLSAEQIQSLQHLGWISEAALKGFTANQMQAFGNDLSGFTAAFLNNLSVDAFNALTAAQLNSLNPVAFTGMDYQHIWALDHFSELTGLLSSLTNDQLLTISQMLTIEQQSVLSEEQKALINKSVDTGFSLVDSVHDPILKNSLHNAVTNDASVFSFTTIESVLKDFASQLTGDLTESQYNDIKNYVQHVGDVCGTDSAVYSLLNGLIGTDGASVYWSATGDGQRIGSLNVGSSVTQFNQLISTWFDGANDPKNSSSDHVDGRPVFAKGGPTINDIQQGGVSDCSLLSALQAVVETAPDFIKSMIVQNPNDTYSVRFFKDGVPHWITVDGNVDGSGTSSANSSWGAIIERAVVDFEATYLNEVNDYSSLPAGFDKLKEITGDTYTTFRALYTTEEKWNTTDFDLLKTAVLNGQPVQLSSWESSKNADTGQTNLVGGHAFAIIGFDDVTNDFILANPWGAFRNDGVQGTFEASMDQMWQHGNSNTGIAIVNSNGASDAAGQLVHAMAAMNTSPSAALTTAALPVNVNNSPLAASHA